MSSRYKCSPAYFGVQACPCLLFGTKVQLRLNGMSVIHVFMYLALKETSGDHQSQASSSGDYKWHNFMAIYPIIVELLMSVEDNRPTDIAIPRATLLTCLKANDYSTEKHLQRILLKAKKA